MEAGTTGIRYHVTLTPMATTNQPHKEEPRKQELQGRVASEAPVHGRGDPNGNRLGQWGGASSRTPDTE